MAKTSAAVKNKYAAKAYDRINFVAHKGIKEELKAHADKYDGGSVNAFIKRAINEQMKRDEKEATT